MGEMTETGLMIGDGDLTRIFLARLVLAFSSSSLEAGFTSVTLLSDGSRFSTRRGLLRLCFCATGGGPKEEECIDSIEAASRMRWTRLLGSGIWPSEDAEVMESKDVVRVRVLRLVPMEEGMELKEVEEAAVEVKSE